MFWKYKISCSYTPDRYYVHIFYSIFVALSVLKQTKYIILVKMNFKINEQIIPYYIVNANNFKVKL